MARMFVIEGGDAVAGVRELKSQTRNCDELLLTVADRLAFVTREATLLSCVESSCDDTLVRIDMTPPPDEPTFSVLSM